MINKVFFQGIKLCKSFDSPAIALAICMVAIGALFKNIGSIFKKAYSQLFNLRSARFPCYG